MTTFRMLAVIPTSAILPGESEPRTASPAEIVRALNQVSYFPQDMKRYSGGMCEIDLSVRVLSETLPESMYIEFSAPQQLLYPVAVAQHIGESSYYDAWIVMSPSNLSTTTTYRGLGGISRTLNTMWMWTEIGSQEREILVHEFAHAIDGFLNLYKAEYTNFPSCGLELGQAIHCGAEYGYIDDLDPVFLKDFFQGTMSDGTGMNATGWSKLTPIQRGEKAFPIYTTRSSPWGRVGPIKIPIV